MHRVYSAAVGWVELPEPPKRIASLNPSATEIVFELGLEDRLVGVSSWCVKPSRAVKKPKIGSYSTINVGILEKLSPDVVLTSTGVQLALAERLSSLGYVVYPLELPRSVRGIIDNIAELGYLFGEYTSARNLSYKMLDLIHALRTLGRNRKRPLVYVELDIGGGPVIPGSYSHITDAFDIAGFEVLSAKIHAAYISGEDKVARIWGALPRRNPDLIVYEAKKQNPAFDDFRLLARKRGWEQLSAVKRGRVLVLPANTLAHHGPSFLREFIGIARKLWEKL